MSFSDLYGAFTGSSQRKDIAKGKAEATDALNTGKTEGIGYYEKGIGDLSPYTEGGQAGLDAYLASLGLKGTEAQQAIQDTYFNDPVQNALMDRIQKGNNRSYTATGMGNSGAATQSLTNALLANWSNYQNQLKGVGDSGQTAATTTAGLRTGQGDIAFGTGQQIAGVNIGAANANAASRSTGINNLLNLAGTAAKAYAAF